MSERFAKLRDLDVFTDEMFNRIIAFQEKMHPAWDAAKSFSERIKGLPLHYLVFSNADRDPAVMAHTVAPFYPLRKEMRRIAECARRVAHETPIVCDFCCGNGFVGSLIGREGAHVIGVQPPQVKPNQIPEFYDAEHFERRIMPVEDIDFPFDVALSSWMPSGVNLTPQILGHQPKLIVFIFTDHVDPDTRVRQTGTDEAFDRLPENYKLIDAWSVTRPKDLFHEVWPDLTQSIEETRHVKIYADRPYHDIQVPDVEVVEVYDWERELEMAQLALAAKNELRSSGMAL